MQLRRLVLHPHSRTAASHLHDELDRALHRLRALGMPGAQMTSCGRLRRALPAWQVGQLLIDGEAHPIMLLIDGRLLLGGRILRPDRLEEAACEMIMVSARQLAPFANRTWVTP